MDTADNPCNFLASPAVEMKVKEMIEIAKKRSLIWKELRIVLAYIAANIIYLDGQRPGVVQRMTVEEWAAKTEVDDEWVIEVMDHKTAGAFGPASVAVSYKVAALMEEYYLLIRGKITPQNDEYQKRFFLTNTGNEYCKISEYMREVADSFGTPLPTSGLQKKVVASEAFKFEDNVVVRGLQKHMCHSAATCEKFYQHQNLHSAVSAKKTVNIGQIL